MYAYAGQSSAPFRFCLRRCIRLAARVCRFHAAPPLPSSPASPPPSASRSHDARPWAVDLATRVRDETPPPEVVDSLSLQAASPARYRAAGIHRYSQSSKPWLRFAPASLLSPGPSEWNLSLLDSTCLAASADRASLPEVQSPCAVRTRRSECILSLIH